MPSDTTVAQHLQKVSCLCNTNQQGHTRLGREKHHYVCCGFASQCQTGGCVSVSTYISLQVDSNGAQHSNGDETAHLPGRLTQDCCQGGGQHSHDLNTVSKRGDQAAAAATAALAAVSTEQTCICLPPFKLWTLCNDLTPNAEDDDAALGFSLHSSRPTYT